MHTSVRRLLLWCLFITVIAVYCWRPPAAFAQASCRFSNLKAQVHKRSDGGAVIVFSANVYVEGVASFSYKWERSDHAKELVNEVKLPGQKGGCGFNDTWPLSPNAPSHHVWERLYVYLGSQRVESPKIEATW